MSNIKLDSTQIKTIDECCKKLNINDDYEVNTTLYDSVTTLEAVCKDLHDKLDTIESTIDDIKMSVMDHDTENLVQLLKALIDLNPEFLSDVNDITKSTADALASFKSVSEKAEYSLLCDDEHIKKLVDENMSETVMMSIGYKDGEYALIFSEVIDDEEQPAFLIEVIANGDEEAYSDIQVYIEELFNIKS